MSDRPIKINLKLTPPSHTAPSTPIPGREDLPKIKKLKLNSLGVISSVEDEWVLPKEKIKPTCTQLLTLLLKHRVDGRVLIEPFMTLVSRKLYPDYYHLIKKPLAIDGVQKRVTSGDYQSMDQFKSDILLVFTNCILI
jgi:Bromodomain